MGALTAATRAWGATWGTLRYIKKKLSGVRLDPQGSSSNALPRPSQNMTQQSWWEQAGTTSSSTLTRISSDRTETTIWNRGG